MNRATAGVPASVAIVERRRPARMLRRRGVHPSWPPPPSEALLHLVDGDGGARRLEDHEANARRCARPTNSHGRGVARLEQVGRHDTG